MAMHNPGLYCEFQHSRALRDRRIMCMTSDVIARSNVYSPGTCRMKRWPVAGVMLRAREDCCVGWPIVPASMSAAARRAGPVGVPDDGRHAGVELLERRAAGAGE